MASFGRPQPENLMRARSSYSLASLPTLLFLLTACASTGATFGSGVGDAFPANPPYAAGARATAAADTTVRVGILPVHFQPGGGQAAMFDPRWAAGSPVAELLQEMNGFLDSVTTRAGAHPVRLITGLSPERSLPERTALGVAPDVRFGCITELDLQGADCAERGDSALGRRRQTMKLAVGRPDARWVQWMAASMDAANTPVTIVITLEVGQYLMKQKGLVGKKIVELGTDHAVELPWLSSLEAPVNVLQLTGVLVDRTGKAVRIGAEGIVAKRTPLLASAVGAQALLTDADVALVRTSRREDLAGQPLAWQVALRTLVRQLTP
jgi:hypothetical protein